MAAGPLAGARAKAAAALRGGCPVDRARTRAVRAHRGHRGGPRRGDDRAAGYGREPRNRARAVPPAPEHRRRLPALPGLLGRRARPGGGGGRRPRRARRPGGCSGRRPRLARDCSGLARQPGAARRRSRGGRDDPARDDRGPGRASRGPRARGARLHHRIRPDRPPGAASRRRGRRRSRHRHRRLAHEGGQCAAGRRGPLPGRGRGCRGDRGAERERGDRGRGRS